jgi:hypothetical protein
MRFWAAWKKTWESEYAWEPILVSGLGPNGVAIQPRAQITMAKHDAGDQSMPSKKALPTILRAEDSSRIGFLQ